MASADIPPNAITIQAIGDEGGQPAYHMRDQELLIRDLPMCSLTPLSPHGREIVRLACISATLQLPGQPSATPVDQVAKTEGWEWSSGDALEISAYRDPVLPGVHVLTLPPRGSDSCHMTICGHPIRVVRSEGTIAGELRYVANLGGFIDDHTRFLALVNAVSSARRDELLAALQTLRLEAS